MSVAIRGLRNAFRNATRTVAIVVILGLVTGLALVMLIAHRAVGEKTAAALSAVGNTVAIGPPGYSAGGLLGRKLTTTELKPIAQLPGVAAVDESIAGAATASNSPPSSALPPSGARPFPTGARTGEKSSSCPGGATICHTHLAKSAQRIAPTSLRYPGTLAFATAGLACEPKPCTPPISSFTIYFTGTTDPLSPDDIGASELRLVSGHAISGTGSAYDAMVSTEMAAKNDLKVGSTFSAYGKTFTVAGIFQTDTAQGNDTVITSLPVLERLSGQPNQVFTDVVTASSLSELPTVTSEIEKTLGSKANVVSYVTDAQHAVSDLDSVKAIALDSLVGAVGAAVVILFLVMLLIVRERKREIGILKAIGAPNTRIAAQFATEAVTFTLLGLVVGLVIGVVAASPITSSLVSHSGVKSDTGARGLFGAGNPVLIHLTSLNAHLGWAVLLDGLAAAIVVAALASAAAAWLIGRVRPAEVLRSV